MMKKIIVIFIFLLSICLVTPAQYIYASGEFYGRIMSTNIYLYSSPSSSDDNQNQIFMLPITYFVKLLGDENDLYYKAEYKGIFGYVKKSEVSCIDKTPVTPYANNISFRIFTPSGANLRTSPNETNGISNLVTTIPFMCTNLEFYGQALGEEAISYKGNVWYYCKYVKDNKDYYGYVYSPLCDLLTNIPQNTETYEYITPNFESISQNTENQDKFLSISTPLQIVIIIAVCLPCILIIYFLFKPTKIAMQKPNGCKPKKEKKKISRLKHSDYYEIDSDYFN